MKQFPLYYSRILAIFVSGYVISGCGAFSKKKSDGDDSSEQQKVAIDTIIESEPVVDNGVGIVSYRSNQSDQSKIKFLCKYTATQADKDEVNSSWQSCDTQTWRFAVSEGSIGTVSVKAIGADGQEDSTPAEKIVRSDLPLTKVQPPAKGELKTLITNKVKIEGKVTETSQVISFGTNSSTPSDQIVYQCKVGDAKEFTACPDGDHYLFSNLQNGKTYSLAVRAVLQDTNTILQADSISFAADFFGALQFDY